MRFTAAWTKFDSSSRVASVTLPSPGHGEATPSKTFTYDPVTGLVASYADSTGTTSITYGIGRAVTRITHPDGTYQTFTAPLTQALVDTAGGLGATESVVYNALGFPVQQFDLAGNETDNTFNWRGQVLTSEGPAPTLGAARPVETFTYNADGQVLTDQNALGGTTQYVYNSFGEVTQEILPSPGGGATQPTLHWTYD
ncbi:MAG TPA: hypothetical protein VF278_25500, partial [Pirellulales bacterium]